MKKNINRKAITKYSEQYAKKLCSKHFSEHKFITGEQILEVSKVKQVNYFILKILFETWTKEIEKLESPFFNYSSNDTKKALKEFMNVLSKNIKIKKKNFEKLAQEATEDTLLLLLDPKEYYTNLFFNCNPLVTEKKLLEFKKYIVIDSSLIDNLILEIKETQNKILPTYEIKKILYSNSLDNNDSKLVQETLDSLSDLVPVDIDEFSTDKTNKSEIIENTANEIVEDTGEEIPLDEVEEASSDEESKLINPEKNKDEIPSYQEVEELENSIKEEDTEVNNTLEEKKEDETAIDDKASYAPFEQTQLPFTNSNDTTLKEVKTIEETSLHDTLKKSEEEKLSIADLHQKQKIEKLSASLSLNQRFRFANELFNGDREFFKGVVEEIDTKENFDEAMNLIHEKCTAEMIQSEESKDTFKDFVELVQKRFE